ncbi:g1279 [Coccomyxa elongata]
MSRRAILCNCQSVAPKKALKEWGPIVEALGRGQQTVLFRKGGIREGVFRPEVVDFFLFPTSFHADGDLLKQEAASSFRKELTYEPKEAPDVRLMYRATITGAWTTFEPNIVEMLSAYHILGPDFLEKRMRWRKQQPITILELRCERLAKPLIQPQSDHFYGCFSWVDVGEVSEHLPAEAALPAAEYERRQVGLRNALVDVNTTDIMEEIAAH